MYTKITELNEIENLTIYTGYKLIAAYFLLNGEKSQKVIMVNDYKQWADEMGCRESLVVIPGKGGEAKLVLTDWPEYFASARYKNDLLDYLQFILPYKSAICL